MNFAGTYTYLMDTPSGKRESRVVIRRNARAYEGELISSHGGCELLENIHTKGDSIIFEAQAGPARQEVTICREPLSGSVVVFRDSGNDEAELEAFRSLYA